jgi:predicted NACHT family NTPase
MSGDPTFIQEILHWFISHVFWEVAIHGRHIIKRLPIIGKLLIQLLDAFTRKKYLENAKKDREDKRLKENCLDQERQYIEPSTVLVETQRYIPPQERERIRNRQPEGEREAEATKEGVTRQPITLQELVIGNYPRVALVADSGMGKTTLLKELVLKIATDEIPTQLIPIYFRFGSIKSEIELDDLIKKIFNDMGVSFQTLDEYIQRLYSDGNCLFLIDGLDQIPASSTIDPLELLKGLGKNKVFFTTRPYAYKTYADELDKSFQLVELQPFDEKKIRAFLGKFYQDKVIEKIRRRAPHLLQTPILLAYIRDILNSGELKEDSIETSSDLYKILIDKLLKTAIQIHEKSGTNRPFPWEQPNLIRLLERLSYLTLDKGFPGYFPITLTTELLPEMEDLGINSEKEFKLLTELGIVSKVLDEPEPDSYLFRHQSFQEYLASLELKRQLLRYHPGQGERPQTLNNTWQEILIKHLEYNRWEEVIYFLIGSLENGVAKQIIEFISRYDFFFAARCIAHYKGDKDGDFRGIIDKLFEQIRKDEAIDALSKIATSSIVTRLIERLGDEDSGVRGGAAGALGNIASRSCQRRLLWLHPSPPFS